MTDNHSGSVAETLRTNDYIDEIRSNCSVGVLQGALTNLPGMTVTSAVINESGVYDSPHSRIEQLPAFCDIRLEISGEAHSSHIIIWAPLNWNGRFLATAGGGNRSQNEWDTDPGNIGVETYDMAPTLASAVRREFATATTDAGVRDERDFSWGLDPATGEIDRELAENWHHKATKDMADAAKVVLRALYTVQPSHSYLVGTSGGGRQTMVTAQKYPEAFDGYWASCPAVNWAHFLPAGLWPSVVMKELGNVLSPAKFEAFRQYALETVEGETALEDGFLSTLSFPALDAAGAVGRTSEDGPLTELDAEVMNRIWGGPRRKNGEPLWYGLPVGAETWGAGLWGAGWIMGYQEHDGEASTIPLSYSTDWLGAWLLRNPSWDWHTLNFEGFEELFDRSVNELGEYDCANPDFTGLRASGGRLMLTHSSADGLIPPQGTVKYHEQIVAALGGPETAADVIRFFVSPGGGHSSTADGYGIGIPLDEGLSALIEWVENGSAPEVLIGQRRSPATGETEITRPVCRYPNTPRYVGGDRSLATSFTCFC